MKGRTLRIVAPSLLHRLLRISPGRAPVWIFGGSSCEGWDLFLALGVLALLAVPAVCAKFGLWSLLVVVPVIVGWMMIAGRFHNRERWGRARRRRQECVWCGEENTASGSRCSRCGRDS